MTDNQIHAPRISEKFNSSAGLTLQQKVEILCKSLPAEKQPEWSELNGRLKKEAERFSEKHKKDRPQKLQTAINAEQARLTQSANNSNMPQLSPRVIEENAKLNATHSVNQQEAREIKKFDERAFALQYDFLKKHQSDHPLVKSSREAHQPTQQLTHSFNLSAARQGGAER